jgi:hypothetical protein
MIAVVAAGLSPAADAWAADASEIQDMRREVAQMRAQVLALQSAVLEATELERQRSAALNKAIKELSSAPAPAAPPPPAPAPSTEPASEPRPSSPPSVRPASGDEKPKSTRQRRHRRSGRSRH